MPWWSELAGAESSAAVTAKIPEALESVLFLDRYRVEGFIAYVRVVSEVLKMPEHLIARTAVLKPKPFLESQKGRFPEQQCSGLIGTSWSQTTIRSAFFSGMKPKFLSVHKQRGVNS